MNTGIKLQLQTRGSDTSNVPVKIEIFDSSFRRVEQRLLRARQSSTFLLEPGLYSVHASVSSGAVFGQALIVRQGVTEICDIPLYEFSPHETQEWAYFTQPINLQVGKSLSEASYEGLWMRLWEKKNGSGWRVSQLPSQYIQINADDDGVSYKFAALGPGLYALQFGGPKIPWKIVAFPSTYEQMVLVRPSSAPAGRTHPLDVVISSTDWELESLLSFMQRGDMSAANDLVEQTTLAEEFLQSKARNTTGAAVGGYFLLRLGSFNRLHNWVEHLDQWYPWLPDGPVIHAWQLIHQVRKDSGQEETLFNQARECLLEGNRRGFPLYTEGLRLLRDGLILLDQRAKGDDPGIRQALEKLGKYTSTADWSAVNSTFLGSEPDMPSAKLRRGTPVGDEPLIYVYDVPLRKALQSGVLKPNDKLISTRSDRTWHCVVSEKGTLDLEDGRSFKSVGALETGLTGNAIGAWDNWNLESSHFSLFWAVRSLRISGSNSTSNTT